VQPEHVVESDLPLPTPEQIPHLSASQISDYLRCPASWYYSRIAKLPQPPVAAIQVGLAIHRGLTAYHRNQDDEVELIAAWKDLVTAPDVPAGAMQRALAAQALYRSLVRPLPIDVADWWFKIRIDGLPVPLIGAFDLVRADAQDPDNGAAWDWKTGKGTNWGQQKADTEIQATIYWLAYTREAEQPPSKFVYVVIQTAHGEPWIKPFTTYRTPEQVAALEDLCREVYRRMMNDPVISTCPRGWCRYPEVCGRAS
jgi:RecB family exonuclease